VARKTKGNGRTNSRTATAARRLLRLLRRRLLPLLLRRRHHPRLRPRAVQARSPTRRGKDRDKDREIAGRRPRHHPHPLERGRHRLRRLRRQPGRAAIRTAKAAATTAISRPPVAAAPRRAHKAVRQPTAAVRR
jgi:hypothetical protein